MALDAYKNRNYVSRTRYFFRHQHWTNFCTLVLLHATFWYSFTAYSLHIYSLLKSAKSSAKFFRLKNVWKWIFWSGLSKNQISEFQNVGRQIIDATFWQRIEMLTCHIANMSNCRPFHKRSTLACYKTGIEVWPSCLVSQNVFRRK
jgi:hypothetical protein